MRSEKSTRVALKRERWQSKFQGTNMTQTASNGRYEIRISITVTHSVKPHAMVVHGVLSFT